MKKNVLLATVIASAALLAFDLSSSRAQSNATPAVAPAPGTPPMRRPPPRRMAPPAMVFQRAIMSLNQAKMQLQSSTNDFGGHRLPALEACTKALEELTAAMKSVPPPAEPMAPAAPSSLPQPVPPRGPQPPPQ